MDDHALLADMLSLTLAVHGFEVTTVDGSDVEAVLRTAGEYRPKFALVDLYLGGAGTGVSLIAPLIALGAQVFVLTAGSSDRRLLARCLQEGALGLFRKDQPLNELVHLLSDAATGVTEMKEHRRRFLLRSLLQDPDLEPLFDFGTLTRREQEVLALLMEGRQASEIASRAFISIATVRSHIRSVLRKLGVNSQLAAVVLAQQAGWTGPAPAGGDAVGAKRRDTTPATDRRTIAAVPRDGKPTVLLVDDDSAVRAMLVAFLSVDGGFEVVGAAPDGAAGVSGAAHLQPDLVLLDLHMPVMDGMTALHEIRRVSPASAVIVLSAFGSDATVATAMRSGAAGFLHKGADLHSRLVPALRQAIGTKAIGAQDGGVGERVIELEPDPASVEST